MKILLVGESRHGKILDATYELAAFADKIGGKTTMFLIGNSNQPPKWTGTIYLADSAKFGEYNPTAHKELLLEVVRAEQPDLIVFLPFIIWVGPGTTISFSP